MTGKVKENTGASSATVTQKKLVHLPLRDWVEPLCTSLWRAPRPAPSSSPTPNGGVESDTAVCQWADQPRNATLFGALGSAGVAATCNSTAPSALSLCRTDPDDIAGFTAVPVAELVSTVTTAYHTALRSMTPTGGAEVYPLFSSIVGCHLRGHETWAGMCVVAIEAGLLTLHAVSSSGTSGSKELLGSARVALTPERCCMDRVRPLAQLTSPPVFAGSFGCSDDDAQVTLSDDVVLVPAMFLSKAVDHFVACLREAAVPPLRRLNQKSRAKRCRSESVTSSSTCSTSVASLCSSSSSGPRSSSSDDASLCSSSDDSAVSYGSSDATDSERCSDSGASVSSESDSNSDNDDGEDFRRSREVNIADLQSRVPATRHPAGLAVLIATSLLLPPLSAALAPRFVATTTNDGTRAEVSLTANVSAPKLGAEVAAADSYAMRHAHSFTIRRAQVAARFHGLPSTTQPDLSGKPYRCHAREGEAGNFSFGRIRVTAPCHRSKPATPAAVPAPKPSQHSVPQPKPTVVSEPLESKPTHPTATAALTETSTAWFPYCTAGPPKPGAMDRALLHPGHKSFVKALKTKAARAKAPHFKKAHRAVRYVMEASLSIQQSFVTFEALSLGLKAAYPQCSTKHLRTAGLSVLKQRGSVVECSWAMTVKRKQPVSKATKMAKTAQAPHGKQGKKHPKNQKAVGRINGQNAILRKSMQRVNVTTYTRFFVPRGWEQLVSPGTAARMNCALASYGSCQPVPTVTLPAPPPPSPSPPPPPAPAQPPSPASYGGIFIATNTNREAIDSELRRACSVEFSAASRPLPEAGPGEPRIEHEKALLHAVRVVLQHSGTFVLFSSLATIAVSPPDCPPLSHTLRKKALQRLQSRQEITVYCIKHRNSEPLCVPLGWTQIVESSKGHAAVTRLDQFLKAHCHRMRRAPVSSGHQTPAQLDAAMTSSVAPVTQATAPRPAPPAAVAQNDLCIVAGPADLSDLAAKFDKTVPLARNAATEFLHGTVPIPCDGTAEDQSRDYQLTMLERELLMLARLSVSTRHCFIHSTDAFTMLKLRLQSHASVPLAAKAATWPVVLFRLRRRGELDALQCRGITRIVPLVPRGWQMLAPGKAPSMAEALRQRFYAAPVPPGTVALNVVAEHHIPLPTTDPEAPADGSEATPSTLVDPVVLVGDDVVKVQAWSRSQPMVVLPTATTNTIATTKENNEDEPAAPNTYSSIVDCFAVEVLIVARQAVSMQKRFIRPADAFGMVAERVPARMTQGEWILAVRRLLSAKDVVQWRLKDPPGGAPSAILVPIDWRDLVGDKSAADYILALLEQKFEVANDMPMSVSLDSLHFRDAPPVSTEPALKKLKAEGHSIPTTPTVRPQSVAGVSPELQSFSERLVLSAAEAYDVRHRHLPQHPDGFKGDAVLARPGERAPPPLTAKDPQARHDDEMLDRQAITVARSFVRFGLKFPEEKDLVVGITERLKSPPSPDSVPEATRRLLDRGLTERVTIGGATVVVPLGWPLLLQEHPETAAVLKAALEEYRESTGRGSKRPVWAGDPSPAPDALGDGGTTVATPSHGSSDGAGSAGEVASAGTVSTSTTDASVFVEDVTPLAINSSETVGVSEHANAADSVTVPGEPVTDLCDEIHDEKEEVSPEAVKEARQGIEQSGDPDAAVDAAPSPTSSSNPSSRLASLPSADDEAVTTFGASIGAEETEGDGDGPAVGHQETVETVDELQTPLTARAANLTEVASEVEVPEIKEAEEQSPTATVAMAAVEGTETAAVLPSADDATTTMRWASYWALHRDRALWEAASISRHNARVDEDGLPASLLPVCFGTTALSIEGNDGAGADDIAQLVAYLAHGRVLYGVRVEARAVTADDTTGYGVRGLSRTVMLLTAQLRTPGDLSELCSSLPASMRYSVSEAVALSTTAITLRGGSIARLPYDVVAAVFATFGECTIDVVQDGPESAAPSALLGGFVIPSAFMPAPVGAAPSISPGSDDVITVTFTDPVHSEADCCACLQAVQFSLASEWGCIASLADA